MAKILSFSLKFAARQKTAQSRNRGLVLLKPKHAQDAKSVRIMPKKDEHHTNRRIPVRAIESFYF